MKRLSDLEADLHKLSLADLNKLKSYIEKRITDLEQEPVNRLEMHVAIQSGMEKPSKFGTVLQSKVLMVLVVMLLSFGTAFSQNVKVDSKGNYVATHVQHVKDTVLVSTGKTYTDTKGVVYPVYTTKNNKVFIMRTSKNTGKQYKQYLKVE